MFINHELDFALNYTYIPSIGKEIINKIDDAIDNEPIEDIDNVQIGDVVASRVGSKNVESALVTMKQKIGTKAYECYTSHLQY